MTRPAVVIEARRAMGQGRRRRIHKMREGKCWFCGKPVEVSGPNVRYDHRLPLQLGGSDDDANLWPLHREPCDRIKTAADMARIAKAKRLAGETCAGETKRPLQGRGFGSVTKKMDGTIGLTAKARRYVAANAATGDEAAATQIIRGGRHG